MIRNYFLIAFRNILKRKLYAFINAFGLSIGIAFCTLIYLYIQDEKSFDQFHLNKDRIYRMHATSYDPVAAKKGEREPYRSHPYMPAKLGEVMRDELVEVEHMTRFQGDREGIMRYKDKVFTEKIAFADSGFFKMFSFRFLSGSSNKMFSNPSDVVITPEIAQKYFASEDPIGKPITLDIEGVKNFTVAGILEAPPPNSSLGFKIVVSTVNEPWFARNREQWGSFGYPTFIQLRPGTNVSTFKTHLDALTQKYMADRFKKWRERESIPAQFKVGEFGFVNLADIHLNTRVSWDKASDPQYSMILGGIAMLILVIACINYISLALTTSASRRIEVGIRKVVGARNGQLVYQFGFESIILGLISMVIGLGLVVLFLPAFNRFTGKGILLNSHAIITIVGVSFLIALLVGILAGSYPAIFLSRFLPSRVLKGGFTAKVQAGFTKPLVVLQFALSAFLIISSVIMYRQMNYITTKDLGYNKDQVLVIGTQTGWNVEADKAVERFRNKVKSDPEISGVAGTSSSFNQGWSKYGYKIKGENKSAFVYRIDTDYIPLLDLQLVAGRNFDERIASDTAGLIVNEALVRDMGWTDPLNEHLNWREDSVGIGQPVIGVVKDYHFLSLEKAIEPMFMSMDKKNVGYLTTMLVKVTPGNVPEKLERVKKAWMELYPEKPFDYTFMDQDVARQYDKYNRWMSIMALSTGFAILIACLGLFGLAGINAINRTKEIGIRKVFGAEIANIFVLLNKQYIVLALIAFALATPASWYVMTRWWLVDFQFKIAVGWELFAVSMISGLGIALLTVSYHAVKASLINPSETLKYE